MEITVALGAYVVLLVAIALGYLAIPSENAALRGVYGMAVNGLAGTLAAGLALALRIRHPAGLGMRPTAPKWLGRAALLGLFAFALSFAVEALYFSLVTETDTQLDFKAAAQAGPLWLTLLLVSGALFTPFGEEVVFRGIVAHALNRYGPWPGIVGSAAIFAVAHGFSVILLDAFLVGLLTGYLFRKTDSLWPGLLLHCTYNALHLLYYSSG